MQKQECLPFPASRFSSGKLLTDATAVGLLDHIIYTVGSCRETFSVYRFHLPHRSGSTSVVHTIVGRKVSTKVSQEPLHFILDLDRRPSRGEATCELICHCSIRQCSVRLTRKPRCGSDAGKSESCWSVEH